MKNNTFLIVGILVLLISPVVAGRNWEAPINQSCQFVSLEEINYSMAISGLGDYSPDLVEYNRGNAYLKVQVNGNWTELQKSIDVQSYLICGDKEWSLLSGNPTTRTFYLSNSTIATEFIWMKDFDVPSGVRYCHAGAYIYGINNTWRNENTCSVPNVCDCFVYGLSRWRTADGNIINSQEAYNKKTLKLQSKSLEIQSGAYSTEVRSAIIAAIVSGIITYLLMRREEKIKLKDYEYSLLSKAHKLLSKEDKKTAKKQIETMIDEIYPDPRFPKIESNSLVARALDKAMENKDIYKEKNEIKERISRFRKKR